MATMTQLRNGSYRVQWYDSSGVRHRHVYADRVRAKEQYELVCGAQLFEKTGLQSSLSVKARNSKTMTFGELADKYVKEHLIPFTRAAMNKSYVELLKLKWGEYRLSQITRKAFKDYLRQALRSPIRTLTGNKQLQASSVDKLLRYAVRVMNWGVENDIIAFNPLARLKDETLKKDFNRLKAVERAILTPEEFWALMQFPELPITVRRPCIASWSTGMRLGEVCNLRWSEIDRDRIVLTADKVKEAKAKTIYMERELFEELSLLEAEKLSAAGPRPEYVFLSEKGRRLSVFSLSKSFRYYCDKYAEYTGNDKYRRVTFHSLRHSYRTRKGREGFDPKVIAKNMGHSSMQMSDHYNHVDEDRQRELSGFMPDNITAVSEQVKNLIDTAGEKGITLFELQSELRRQWLLKVRVR